MSKIYVPNLSEYQCVVVQNATTLRAYTTEPRRNSSSVYDDYYYMAHYTNTTGTQTWGSTSTLPTCLSTAQLTDNVYYRNDFSDILIIFSIIVIFGLVLPWKIFTQMFKRWRL